MQRFGRWREAAHIVSQVRSRAVMWCPVGEYYEIALALQRAVAGQAMTSPGSTCGGLKNSPPRFVTLEAIAPDDRRVRMRLFDWRVAATTLGTPFAQSSR